MVEVEEVGNKMQSQMRLHPEPEDDADLPLPALFDRASRLHGLASSSALDQVPPSSGSPLRPSHKRQETGLSGCEWCLLRALIFLRWAGRDPEGGRAAAALRRDGQQARPLLH